MNVPEFTTSMPIMANASLMLVSPQMPAVAFVAALASLAALSTPPAITNASTNLQHYTNTTSATAITDYMLATTTPNTPTSTTANRFMFDGLMLAKFNTTHTQQANDLIYSIACTVLFSTCYLCILIGGLFGNALVCYVVVRNKAMQTVTNMFITNLAVSDILMCLLCLPFTPAYMYMRRWPFGLVMCHTVAFTQTTSVYISTLTLMAIAIDRFSVIMHPFQQRMRMGQCIAIIVLIWVASLLFSSPFGWYQHLVPANMTGTWDVYCEEKWGEGTRRLFATLTTGMQFVVPFVVIAFCYTSVSIRLTVRAKSRPGNKTGKKDEVDRERKRRTNRMLVYMVVVFGVVWLPLNTINMLNDWYIINAEESDYYNICFILSHLFAMSSTCYNPVLYAWKNDNFRKEFQLVLPCYKTAERAKTTPPGGCQRWQPEQTYNGNNETMQESLLTSSFVRSTCPSVVATGCNGGQDGGMHKVTSDDHILLSEIEPGVGVTSMRIGPETHVLPSGVLETNFEEAYGVPQRAASKGCRIRFEEDQPDVVVGAKKFECIA